MRLTITTFRRTWKVRIRVWQYQGWLKALPVHCHPSSAFHSEQPCLQECGPPNPHVQIPSASLQTTVSWPPLHIGRCMLPSSVLWGRRPEHLVCPGTLEQGLCALWYFNMGWEGHRLQEGMNSWSPLWRGIMC